MTQEGKVMTTRFVALCFVLLCGVTHAETEPPIRVLIVDGFSNHDWARTTAFIPGASPPLVRIATRRGLSLGILVSSGPAAPACDRTS